MATIFTDNFTRANSTDLGTNWGECTEFAASLGFDISSNTAIPGDRTNDTSETEDSQTYPDDQWAEATFAAVSSAGVGSGAGVMCRAAQGSVNTRYRLVGCASGYELGKFVAEAFTSLSSGSGTTFAASDVIRLETVTSGANCAWTLKKNGTTFASGTDTSPIASGRPGVAHSSTTTTDALASFSAGDFSGVTITGVVGDAASAASTSALNRTVVGVTGNTASSGSAAAVLVALTLSGLIGNSTADGSTAAISAATNIAGVVGNAPANGSNASLNTSVLGSIGASVADGSLADIATGVTLSGITGDASSAGSTTALNRAIVGGSAVVGADGAIATIANNSNITGVLGNATSAGLTVALNRTIIQSGVIDVSWVPSADINVTGYFVYWDTVTHSGGVGADYANSADVTGRLTDTYKITGLNFGQTYFADMSSHGAGGHDAFESALFGESSLASHTDTADADGAVAALNRTIVAVSADVSASGQSAAVASAITIAGNVGDTAANGDTASVLSSQTITGVVGGSTANGSSATVERAYVASTAAAQADGLGTLLNRTVASAVGDSTAAGSSAVLSREFTASVGDAQAIGLAFGLPRAVLSSIGSADAQGSSASISGVVVIGAGVGDASASGGGSLIVRNFTCSTGNTQADGVGATISRNFSVGGIVGNGVSSGPTSLLNIAVSSIAGNSTAAGESAAVSGVHTVGAITGGAVAEGSPAGIDLWTTTLCTVGNASAGGGSAIISAGGIMTIPVLYTTTQGIRATLGVDLYDVSDQMILDANLDLSMLQRLGIIRPDHATFFATTIGAPLLTLWCQYYGALVFAETAQMAFPMKIQANQDAMQRFTIDFDKLLENLRSRLRVLEGLLDPTLIAVGPSGLLGIAKPSYDPVTGV
jgi:hypothetical protein